MKTKERMRGFKGLVRRVRAGAKVVDRQLNVSGLGFPERRNKTCTWCWEPVDEPRKRYWHSHCAVWQAATKCQLSPYAAERGLIPSELLNGDRAAEDVYFAGWYARCCAVCELTPSWQGDDAGLEIDHRLGIAIAVELGPRAVMRAYLPSNLQYLCQKCHKAKTKQDAGILKILRRGMEKYPKPKPERTLSEWEKLQGKLALDCP